MNFALIVPAVLTTGGILTTSTVVSVNYSAKDSENKASSSTEISAKNIAAITNIGKLQTDNKIADLTKESISQIKQANTSINPHNAAPLVFISTLDEHNINSSSNDIKNNQKKLEDLWEKQIKLAKEKTVYTEIQSHFSTTIPDKNVWEIVEDSTSSTTPMACKIAKKSNPAAGVTVTTPKDTCDYGWQILSISLEDKIKALLVDNQELKGKFDTVTTVAP